MARKRYRKIPVLDLMGRCIGYEAPEKEIKILSAFSDGENPVIVENNTCAFLSAMLQCIQSIINQAGDRRRIRGPDTEHTAFLMKMSCFHHS